MKALTEAATIMREQAKRLQTLADGPKIDRAGDIGIREATQRLALANVVNYELSTTLSCKDTGAYKLRFHGYASEKHHFGDSLAEVVAKIEAESAPHPPAAEGEAAVAAAERVLDGATETPI